MSDDDTRRTRIRARSLSPVSSSRYAIAREMARKAMRDALALPSAERDAALTKATDDAFIDGYNAAADAVSAQVEQMRAEIQLVRAELAETRRELELARLDVAMLSGEEQ